MRKAKIFKAYIFEDGFTFITYSIKKAKKFAKNNHGEIIRIEE
jgi:hypothetical protein